MKCDMHVHSYNSGACTSPVLRAFCRESYSDPAQVYETLQRRGMDLITLTDHDSPMCATVPLGMVHVTCSLTKKFACRNFRNVYWFAR